MTEDNTPREPVADEPRDEPSGHAEPVSGEPGGERAATGERPEAAQVWADATGSTDTGPDHDHPTGNGPDHDRATGSESGKDHGTDADSEEPGGEDDAVRRETWPYGEPAELDVSVDVGRIEVTLADSASAVEAELRAEQSWGGGWHKGLTSMFSWLNEATGGTSSIRIGGREISFGGLGGGHFDLRDLAGRDLVAEAVHGAEVTWSESARRLVVRSARTLPARLVPLAVTVRAAAGSRVILRTGAGQITVTGRAGGADLHTGSGDIDLDTVAGDLTLRTGSGTAAVRAVSGRAKAKTGSGDIMVDTLDGPAEVQSGSGDLRLGGVRADLFARTGSGDLTVADAQAGRLDLTTGSGNLRVGVHPGVAAEVDLHSGSGRARSELEVSDSAPSTEPALRIAGRSGNGDVLVTRALSATGAAG